MLTLFSGQTSSSIWLYWLGPLIGGALAGGLFRVTHPSEVDGRYVISPYLHPPCPPQAFSQKCHPSLCGTDGSEKIGVGIPKPPVTDYIMEFIGTFLLSFTVTCATAPSNTSGLAPISIGAMLMANVYAGGEVSGGHYNPAVTIAVGALAN